MMAFLQRLQKHLGTYKGIGGWSTFDYVDMWIQKGGSQSNVVYDGVQLQKIIVDGGGQF